MVDKEVVDGSVVEILVDVKVVSVLVDREVVED